MDEKKPGPIIIVLLLLVLCIIVVTALLLVKSFVDKDDVITGKQIIEETYEE